MFSVGISSILFNSIANLDDMIKKLDDYDEQLAEAKHQRDVKRLNRNLPLEELRDKCLLRISKTRQAVILNIRDAELMKRSLIALLASAKDVYEAAAINDLDKAMINVESIETILENIKEDKKDRKSVRFKAVIVSLLGAIGIGIYLFFSEWLGVSDASVLKIIKLPVPVILWSVIGSLAAILYRFTNAGDSELREPLRWLFARPLSGVLMGAVTFLIVKVGLISMNADDALNRLNTSEVMYLIAFLAGFSDRFSDYLLKTAVGSFGDKADGDLLTLEMRTQTRKDETGNIALPEMDGDGDNPPGDSTTSKSPNAQPETAKNGDNSQNADLPESGAAAGKQVVTETKNETKIEFHRETKADFAAREAAENALAEIGSREISNGSK